MNVTIHIERVVVDDGLLRPHDVPRLIDALTASLRQVIATERSSTRLTGPGSVPWLDGGSVTHGAARNPRVVGETIALALDRAIAGAQHGPSTLTAWSPSTSPSHGSNAAAAAPARERMRLPATRGSA